MSIAKSIGFALVLVLAVYAITSPWAFYMGGHFHPLAYWQGWGTVHAPEGDYVVLMLLTAPERLTEMNGQICPPQSIAGRRDPPAD